MIFILDENPKKTAEYLDDRSLAQQIKDIAQVLCNVHHEIINEDWGLQLYEDTSHWRLDAKKQLHLTFKESLRYEKWSQWARECKANYLYLVGLGYELIKEYHYRFNMTSWSKRGKFYFDKRDILAWARDNVPDLPKTNPFIGGELDDPIAEHMRYNEPTPFPLIIPKKYEEEKIINSYRNFYRAKLRQIKDKHDLWIDDVRSIGMPPGSSIECVFDRKIVWTNRNPPEWLIL